MAVTRFLRFKKDSDLNDFLNIFGDILVPWSESVIDCETFITDKRYPVREGKRIRTNGHHDDWIRHMMERGYKIEDGFVKIHIEPDDFKGIEKVFEKNKWMSHKCLYDYVGVES